MGWIAFTGGRGLTAVLLLIALAAPAFADDIDIRQAIEDRIRFDLDNPWDDDTCEEYLTRNLDLYNRSWEEQGAPERQLRIVSVFAGSLDEGEREEWLTKLYGATEYTFQVQARPSAASPPAAVIVDVVGADPSLFQAVRGVSGTLLSLRAGTTTQATIRITMGTCGSPDMDFRECSFCVGMLEKAY